MTASITGIIDQLEQQKAAIERALAALRAIETAEAPARNPQGRYDSGRAQTRS